MPLEQIPIGVNLPVLAGVVYATPSIPVTLTSGALVQSSSVFAGPFTDYTGIVINRVYIKPTVNTTVLIKKVKPGSYFARVLKDGASNFWRLGESSGLVAVDSVGGANGTISGGVTLGAAGALSDGNKAMTFDGATGKIVTAVLPILTIPLTVEAWVRSTQATGDEIPFLGTAYPNTGSNDALILKFTFGHVAFTVYHSNATGSFGDTTGNLDGAWHHVVLVFPGGTGVQIYVDGVLKTLTPPALTTAAVGFRSGSLDIGWSQAWPRYWPGLIDEVAIYPRALTAPEIAAHYNLRFKA